MGMKALHKLGLCLIIIASFATVVLASCPGTEPGPPCLAYWQTDAVFIAVADRVVHVPNNTALAIGPYLRSTVYFTIEEAFKGVGGTALVMELGACGHVFKEGERYLVYANRDPNNKELDVRQGWTRTRLLSEADADLKYIRGLATAEFGSRVFGKVALNSHNVKEPRHEVEPLKNIKVALEGNEQHYEVFTDSEGRYEFRRVLPGTYRLRAEIPGSYRTYDDPEIRLNGRDCLPADIWATRKGQIMGRVVDENEKPLPSVPISLVSADARIEEIFPDGKGKPGWPVIHTDREGRFWFTRLAPGRYLLVMNLTQSETTRTTGTSRALPRLFYPGVSDFSGATVIVVGDSSDQRVYEFRLPGQ